MKNKLIIAAALLTLVGCAAPIDKTELVKPRVIITCDPELDDNNSLIRYVLHATDFRTEGIIYASSQFHWKGDGTGKTWYVKGREYDRPGLNFQPMTHYRWDPEERFIDNIIDAYTECYPNLKVHDPSYPTPEYMKSIVKWGNVEFDGDFSKETDGSKLIEERILAPEEGPLFIQAWGGASTIARALKSIIEKYESTSEWENVKNKVNSTVVLCLSGDQDNTYANYIKDAWPDVHVQSVQGAKMGLSYNSQARCPEEDKLYYSPEWMAENICIGPLGALERVWGDGKQFAKGDIFDFFGEQGKTVEELKAMGYVVWSPIIQPQGSFLGEGDDYCYLQQIGNGLRAWEDETWGGWGGRRKIKDEAKPQGTGMGFGFGSRKGDDAIPDFFPACQNELAGRMKWSVTPNYADANHFPVLAGPRAITAAAGKKVKAKATATDPDGDAMDIKWWQFKTGSYEGDVTVDSPATAATTFTVPADAKSGETFHLIMEVTDHGTPALTRYHRLTVTVK